MKKIQEKYLGISTVLAFSLIPLSGFTTDIYIPSLPAMARHFQVSGSAVQLTLAIFMVSGGLSQLFIGSLLDSFGRYRLGLAAILVFSLSSFAIGVSGNIELVYVLRAVQGIAVSVIVVGKRAFFVDMYSGEKLRNYIGMFSIVWASAPILAPFIGGYLQAWFGWQSDFFFLGAVTIAAFVLEVRFGGESLRNFTPFRIRPVLSAYSEILGTRDYAIGLGIIALSYALLVIYGMVSPFIIEHVYGYSAITTGYSSLLSGAALMTGGIISKTLAKKPLVKKASVAISLQVALAAIMAFSATYGESLVTFIGFTLAIHLLSGFVFNNFFAYCLGRFSAHAGIVSGTTGGALFALTSIFSYSVVNLVSIKNQQQLAVVFLASVLLLGVFFVLFARARTVILLKPALAAQVDAEAEFTGINTL